MTHHIREALLEDADQILDCMNEAFKKYIPFINRKPEPMLLNYAEIIKDHPVYILEVDSEFGGVLVLSEGDEGFMWLEVLGIYDKFQNLGYGKILIEYGESVMRDLKKMESRVFTNVSFANSIAMYKHLGYIEYDRRMEKDYHRVYLKKNLTAQSILQGDCREEK